VNSVSVLHSEHLEVKEPGLQSISDLKMICQKQQRKKKVDEVGVPQVSSGLKEEILAEGEEG